MNPIQKAWLRFFCRYALSGELPRKRRLAVEYTKNTIMVLEKCPDMSANTVLKKVISVHDFPSIQDMIGTLHLLGVLNHMTNEHGFPVYLAGPLNSAFTNRFEKFVIAGDTQRVHIYWDHTYYKDPII